MTVILGQNDSGSKTIILGQFFVITTIILGTEGVHIRNNFLFWCKLYVGFNID